MRGKSLHTIAGKGLLVAGLLGFLLLPAAPAQAESAGGARSSDGPTITTATSFRASSYEETGFFCSACTTDASARQLALNAVPPPECDWGPHGQVGEAIARSRDFAEFRQAVEDNLALDPRDMPECGAPLRQVVIGNHDTYQLFAYLVGWDQDAWEYAILQNVNLDADQVEGYELLIDFRLHWEDFLSQPIALSDLDVKALPRHYHGRETADCPGITVLNHVLDRTAEVQLERMLRERVADNIADFQGNGPWESGGQSGEVLDHERSGFRISNVYSTFIWPDLSQDSRDAVSIVGPVNEYGEHGDRLLYRVDLSGVSAGGTPAVMFERLDRYSAVLGVPVNDVLSGAVNVEDNPCVRDKLANRADQEGDGEWRSRTGGHTIDQSQLRGPERPPGPMCYVDFYQGGRLLYSFRVDCGRTDEE